MILNHLKTFIFLDRSADAELEKIRRFNCILLKAVMILFTFCCLSACSNLHFRSSKVRYHDLTFFYCLTAQNNITFLLIFFVLSLILWVKIFFKKVSKYKTKMQSHQKTKPFNVYCISLLRVICWSSADLFLKEEQHSCLWGCHCSTVSFCLSATLVLFYCVQPAQNVHCAESA